MADLQNVKLGVCTVNFKTNDLGHTRGGVTLVYSPDVYDSTVDKYGSTVAKKFLIGEKLQVKVPLAESTIDNFGIAIPAGTADANKVTIGRSAGYDLTAEAGELILHPTANAAGDLSDDVKLYKAISTAEVEVGFTNDGERIIEVTFDAIVDESKTDGDYLGVIGDDTAV